MALVMFDYDGVIVDSLEQFTKDFIAACQEHGFKQISEKEDALALFDVNVYESMKKHGLDGATIDRILTTYEARAQKSLTKVRLFEGIAEALKQIAESNKIFIITSNLSSITRSILREHGIECFEDVIGADKEKSKIKKIQTTMLKYPELLAYYVGDTRGDIIEGKEAGAKTIGVAWGWHELKKLKAMQPDFTVDSPDELAQLFR